MSDAKSSPMPTPDLAGLLARVPAPPQTASVPAPPPTNESVALAEGGGNESVPTDHRPAPLAARDRSRSSKANKPPGHTKAPRQYLRSMAVYLPRSLHQQLRQEAAVRDTTATALLLAAVNGTHERVGDALAQSVETSGGDRNLFDIPQSRRPGEPTVQTTIRVTDGQHQVLNNLASTHGVNRSQLITTALRLYLGALPSSQT